MTPEMTSLHAWLLREVENAHAIGKGFIRADSWSALQKAAEYYGRASAYLEVADHLESIVQGSTPMRE